MKFEQGKAVALFTDEGLKISALPVFANNGLKPFLWLQTDDGLKIACRNATVGVFYFIESGKTVYSFHRPRRIP